MDFQTLSRRQLQALCKKNKIPANITNLAMADALNALEFVEGLEEILNQSESEIAQSPMVPPTGGRSRTAKAVGMLGTPMAAPTTTTRRRAASASTSVMRKIEVSSNESLDEIEEVKKDVSVNTPAVVPASRRRVVRETTTVKHAYSTRRSARLSEKIEEPKERSEAIKINSFAEVIDENVDQSENTEITVVDNFKESEVNSNDESKQIWEETSETPNADVAVASIEQKIDTDEEEIEPVNGLVSSEVVQEYNVSEEVCGKDTEGSVGDAKMCAYVAQETKASVEDTEINSNVNEEVEASFEDYELNYKENEEVKTSFEDNEMNPNMDEEIDASVEKVVVIYSCLNEASFEDNIMNSNMDEKTEAYAEKVVVINSNINEASFENNEMNSNMDEETEASVEKVIVIESNVNEASLEDGEIKTNVDEAPKAVSTEEDTDMNTEDDEEINIADIKVADIADSCNVVVNEQETYADEIENDDHMADIVAVNMQDTTDEELPSENETLDDEELDMSEVEIQDNHEMDKIEYVFADDVSVAEFNQEMNIPEVEIQVGKENVDSGIKSVLVKEPEDKPLEEQSLRQLNKMFKEKLNISKQQKKGDGKEEEITKATTTRPALKKLSENRIDY